MSETWISRHVKLKMSDIKHPLLLTPMQRVFSSVDCALLHLIAPHRSGKDTWLVANSLF